MTDPRVTLALHGDRTLLGHDDEKGDPVPGWADTAYDAIRAMNHITQNHAVPAPVAYAVLGNLAGLAHMLPQLLDQLARGLGKSLTEFDVYDDKGDPAESIAAAQDALGVAATFASSVAEALDEAHAAINSQGYGRG